MEIMFVEFKKVIRPQNILERERKENCIKYSHLIQVLCQHESEKRVYTGSQGLPK